MPPDGSLEALGSSYLLSTDLLGRGAMGRVYLGYRRETEEPLAIKVLRPELAEDPEVVARFLQERSVLIGLDHPNLVRVHDLVLEAGTAAVVMDLVNGPDLRRVISKCGRIDQEEALSIGLEVLDALAAVHARNILHRDVKPENVLMDSSGHAHLTDFGIAKIMAGPTVTRMTGLIGTPEYIAPEAVESNDNGPASDVYSTGILLYELVAGNTPFAGGSPLAVLRRHVEEPPKEPPAIDSRLWDLLVHMLVKEPTHRPSAAEAAATCRELLRDHAAAASALASTIGSIATSSPVPAAPRHGTVLSSRTSAKNAGEKGGALTTDTVLSSRKTADLVAGASVAAQGESVRNGRRTTRLRARHRALLAVCISLAVLVAGIVVATQGGNRAVLTSANLLKRITYGETLALHGRDLQGEIVVRNTTTAPAKANIIEVLPTSVAASTSEIHSEPHATTLVSDPVIEWKLETIGPESSRSFKYWVTIPRYSEPATAERQRIWQQMGEARAAYVRSNRSSDAIVAALNALTTNASVRLHIRGLPVRLVSGSNHLVTVTATQNGRPFALVSSLGSPKWTATGMISYSGSGSTIRVVANGVGDGTLRVSLGGQTASERVEVVKRGSPTGPSPGGNGKRTVDVSNESAVSVGQSQVELTWTTTPANSAVTIECEGDTACASQSTSASTAIVGGLTPSERYKICVEPNGAGSGECLTVTTKSLPAGAPGMPRGLTFSNVSSTSMTVGWQAPSSDGGSPITRYVAQTSSGNECETASLSCTIGGLQPRQEYQVWVYAYNKVSEGPGDEGSQETGWGHPGDVSSLSLSPGLTSIGINFSAPTETGGGALVFVITVNGANPATISSTSYTVTGLSEGSAYRICVTAQNQGGLSSPDQTCGSVETNTTTTTTTTTTLPPTWSEYSPGVAHTWTDYADAGGTEGPNVDAQWISVSCRVQGFVVADGNPWWYRIAQSPWNNQYYVSADAFCNDGTACSSLAGTPFVDSNVRGC